MAEDDPNVSQESFTQADVQAMIDEALAKQNEKHQDDIEALRKSLVPEAASAIPAHAGGIGTRISDTWSLFEQELSRAGLHPDQAQQNKTTKKG